MQKEAWERCAFIKNKAASSPLLITHAIISYSNSNLDKDNGMAERKKVFIKGWWPSCWFCVNLLSALKANFQLFVESAEWNVEYLTWEDNFFSQIPTPSHM